MRPFLFILLILLMVACQPEDKKTREAEMYNSSGDMVGTATFGEQSDGVKIKVELEGLEPGFHGIHVHEYAKCEGPDFKSAGNHFNPTGAEHGLMHPEGPHLGDLPNIEADASGVANADLMLPQVTLLDGKDSLTSGEGTSIIVTKNEDDGMTQPGGDSGERIICGTLTKEKSKGGKSPTDPTQNNDESEE
ncbi:MULTISPECIES: superoxide dismutase family protein [Clostridia]|uniref:superoxide dismutase family protein n=1 Tax=Clostridia TaxID=186801 RepID=UPI000EA363E9|nr:MULTISPECIES: superoxide dismutase family protein [Clostridia]NBJ69269.1 superoxide dismutase family protein [Roseburia sp. 1XD42-34]RKI79235.1 superoxide dismutase family protein [Clostridium sp. 1xD42-85]